MKPAPYKITALIYPIERHVGHWACSSASIDLDRIVMEGDQLESHVEGRLLDTMPHAIAIIGKQVNEYNDLLDRITRKHPSLAGIPRIYRCQNTVLHDRAKGRPRTKAYLSTLDHWYKNATDPRFDLILVQTLTDVELMAETLAPTLVAPCPYGYDTEIFHGQCDELERKTDVGCYFNLRNDNRRATLVEKAEQICRKHDWSFNFTCGHYWHDYARLIRTTKVCLHHTDKNEIPFRIYETSCFGTVFISDHMGCHIEKLFEKDVEYLTYKDDFSDLENVLTSVLDDTPRWKAISQAARKRASSYTWSHIAEEYVVPALKTLLGW